ncbi:MAG: hypothetical protein A3D92_11970 [Bacteroidetes bacterium RIFCSPHIGHO2_02_FULL_44_7]|nr:MAG: hypothetical protein A3D92_11970 [Bacteroidetes bacterium RIFCSPHIGHO2_02_FULL_44_7]
MLKPFLALLALNVSLCVLAQDPFSPLAQKVMANLHLNPDSCISRLVAEKELPYQKGAFVVAIPYAGFREFEEEDFMASLYVVIVDGQNGHIKQQVHLYADGDYLSSDAIRLDEIKIDTAPYIVAEGKRAFGIRIKYRGMSRVNPYGYENLNLILSDGNQLVEILHDCQTYQDHGEWDGNCNGQFTEENSVLVMQQTKNEGYFNIAMKHKIIHSVSYIDENGECQETSCEMDYTSHIRFEEGMYREIYR